MQTRTGSPQNCLPCNDVTESFKHIQSLKEDWVHFQGWQLGQIDVCFPSEKRSTLKKRNVLNGSKFFPIRGDSFTKETLSPEKHTGSHKRCTK